MVTHVVLFKLKDGSRESIPTTVGLLKGLAGKVPVIRSLEVGTDVLRSSRSFDISLIVKFDSLADLSAYQAHPEHVKVADYIGTVRDSVVVVDYES